MADLAIGGAYESITVDLWGHEFLTTPVTRSVEKQVDALERQMNDATDSDEEVRLVGELLDLRLRPANGKRTKASTLITRAWAEDKLSSVELVDFCQRLGEADRPT